MPRVDKVVNAGPDVFGGPKAPRQIQYRDQTKRLAVFADTKKGAFREKDRMRKQRDALWEKPIVVRFKPAVRAPGSGRKAFAVYAEDTRATDRFFG